MQAVEVGEKGALQGGELEVGGLEAAQRAQQLSLALQGFVAQLAEPLLAGLPALELLGADLPVVPVELLAQLGQLGDQRVVLGRGRGDPR